MILLKPCAQQLQLRLKFRQKILKSRAPLERGIFAFIHSSRIINTVMNPSTPIACIYHKDCVDGTTAAAVVLRKYPNAIFFPLSHRYLDELDGFLNTLSTDTHVLMVDTAQCVNDILARGFTITVVDHHVSRFETMQTLADTVRELTFVYDSTKSGSSLTWSYLFPEEPLPEIIRYVEDSDLWKEQYMPTTKDVVHYLSIFRNKPAEMLAQIEGPTDIIKARGATISVYTDQAIEHLITIPPITIKLGEYQVTAHNITDHESACGNRLAQTNGKVAVMFTVIGDRVKFSFRSLAGQSPSALDLAQIVNGGGHTLAAGGEMPLAKFLSCIEVGV